MILRRIRSGLNFEDEAMRDFGIISTPAAFTPVAATRAPLPVVPQIQPVSTAEAVATVESTAVKAALEEAVECEELQSVKEEELDTQVLEAAADKLTLFPVEVVSAGVVEIESSSGSDSSSSSSESESSSTEVVAKDQSVRFTESVPEGLDYFRHAKSGIVHSCKLNEVVSKCKLSMSGNYKKLERQFHFKYPKCLRCFPKDGERIRTVGQLTQSLDNFIKRARTSEQHEELPKGTPKG
eukprot:s2564_g10.t1